MATTPGQENRRGIAAGTMAISETRKQMLMDNLQLEITERARKLRAQYALQAQALRTRLEMRVNRIPHSLRGVNMQKLLDQYAQPQKTAASIVSPHKVTYSTLSSTAAISRGLKRPSDAVPDKENELPAGDLENPKKRVKTTAPISAVPIKPAARTASRKPGPSSVLSPKSHNSRTYPISPIKSASPVKAASPVKESTLPKPTARGTAAAASRQPRPTSRQVKRPAVPTESGFTAENRPSSGSDASSGTTIMKRAVPTATAAAAARKAAPAATKSRTAGIKNALSSLTGSKRGATTKKAAAATAPSTAAAATTTVGGRTLRKRGSPVSTAPATTAASRLLSSLKPSLSKSASTKTLARTAVGAAPPLHTGGTAASSAPVAKSRRSSASKRQLSSSTTTTTTAAGVKKRRSSGPRTMGSRRVARAVEKGRRWLGRE